MAEAPFQPKLDGMPHRDASSPAYVSNNSQTWFQSPHGSDEASETAFKLRLKELHERYAQERDKRIRPDSGTQYINATASAKFKHFAEDCWVATDQPTSNLKVENDDHHKIVIVGAGFGGLLFAVRLIQAGFSPDDLIIVDAAGGFGGTWYWNRYPGLMCDTEAYIYMPLLEETGYMPKNKYAYGYELRGYANGLAERWRFNNRALFRTEVQKLEWNQDECVWYLNMARTSNNGLPEALKLTADFVLVASGLLHKPKLTAVGGLDNYKGDAFHTARWDYSLTGGSPEDPSLVRLRDKKVGILGTGASAIQAVPHLAKFSKELYVFQRTASSVDVRGQQPTDRDWWVVQTQGRKGWQRERSRNFIEHNFDSDPPPETNMVNDGWTRFPSFAGLAGTNRVVMPSEVPAYTAKMQALDFPRSERIRARAEEVVTDKQTAEKLKAWYYGWCKRPTFHDDYLPTFNLPNVTLVDTDGKGIEDICERGIVTNGQVYDLDIIIFSTGFDFNLGSSPMGRADILTIGRNGKKLEDKWSQGIKTLHGIITRDFPNLFFTGLSQGAASINLTSALDVMAQHTAYIMSAASKKGDKDARFSIEPTATAEENWANRIPVGAAARAPVMGCTPSYYNAEGAKIEMTPEMLAKATRAGTWPFGLNSFQDLLDDWHRKGDLSELEIRFV